MIWDPPQPDQRNGIIRRYAINITTLTDQQTVFHSLLTTTSHTVSSLRPYSSYSCAVAAETGAGRGPHVTQTVRTPEDGKSLKNLGNKLNRCFISIPLISHIRHFGS